VADGGQLLCLPAENRAPAESLGVEELEEDGRAPFLRSVGPSVPGEPGGERLDEESEREALVPEVETPEGKDRAGPRGEERGRIVGRRSVRVHDPGPRQTSARLVQPLRERVRGRAHAHVHEHGLGAGGKAGRHRVRRDPRRDAAVRCDPGARWVRAGEQDHDAVLRDRLQVGLEAADVVRAADDDGDRRVLLQALARGGDRALRQPRARQPPPVPHERGPAVAEHLGIAVPRHRSRLDLAQVSGEHVEAVRRVAEKIRLDQDLRHRARLLGRKTGAGEESRGKGGQRVRCIAFAGRHRGRGW
jgi:hypothetical protein